MKKTMEKTINNLVNHCLPPNEGEEGKAILKGYFNKRFKGAKGRALAFEKEMDALNKNVAMNLDREKYL